MLPEISIFGAPVSAYGLCAAVGLILLGVVALIFSRKSKILIEDILFGEIVMLIGAFIGAHILYGITNLPDMIHYLGLFFEEGWDGHFFFDIIFKFMDGMVYYGGLIGAILFGMLYCKVRKLRLGDFSDSFAVGIPLFHAIARLGCFFAGCCYGIESPFGYTTHSAIINSANGVNRFPVQLLECGVNLLIFVALIILFRSEVLKGYLLTAYLIIYGVARFFIEFLRGDEYRGFLWIFSTSQWISILLVGISVFILCKRKVKIIEKV